MSYLKRAYIAPDNNPHNPQRPIKGSYIHEVLFLNSSLSGSEKILLQLIEEINVGEGCPRNDIQLSQFMKYSARKLSIVITDLISRKYLLSIPENKIIVNWNFIIMDTKL